MQHLPHRHFWHVQFPACSSHWLAGTLQKCLTHPFNFVIRHTRLTRTLAFTQAPSFHKLSVPPSYVIPAWCVFSKSCTKLTLHCVTDPDTSKRSTGKPFPAAIPSWKLAPWPHSKHEKWTAGSTWETWTVAAADCVRCARVRWEINFLLTFETAPFFCVCPVHTQN